MTIISFAKTPSELRADVVLELAWRWDNAKRAYKALDGQKTTRAQRAAITARYHLTQEILTFWMDIWVEDRRWDAKIDRVPIYRDGKPMVMPEVTSEENK